MFVPCYPDFEPLSLDQRDEIYPLLSQTVDGISEFTFSNLYLFRKRYQYRVATLPGGGLIISGKTPDADTAFFSTPCVAPSDDVVAQLFKTHDYWKNIPPSLLESSVNGIPYSEKLEALGISVSEDRDNFDYLYLRTELAALSGKKFHKKKNLVNAFLNAWPDHEGRPLEPALIPDAMAVLENWKKDKGEEGDYIAARESLELFTELRQRGSVYYVNKRPVAYCMGESVSRGTMFAIHFEKGLEQYKGIYQYINQAFAEELPPEFILLNREQDLGNEGMRQAKMTYRPVDFVKKYRGVLRG